MENEHKNTEVSDSKTLLIVVVTIVALVVLIGFRMYHTDKENVETRALKLESLRLEHEREMEKLRLENAREEREAQQKLSESERRNRLLQHAESLKMNRDGLSKNAENIILNIRKFVRRAGSGKLIKKENGEVWTRQYDLPDLTYGEDSIFRFSRRSGGESGLYLENAFRLSDTEKEVIVPAEDQKAVYLEFQALYGRPLFTYCEKQKIADNCTQNDKSTSFRMYLNNRQTADSLHEFFSTLRFTFAQISLTDSLLRKKKIELESEKSL